MTDDQVEIDTEVRKVDLNELPVSLDTQNLLTPEILESHGNFGIGYYQSEGEPRVYIPLIADRILPSGMRINLASKPGGLSDEVRLNLVVQLLTSEKSITGIVDDIFNHSEEPIGLIKEGIPDEEALEAEFSPKFSIAIIGPSNIGKSNLVHQLGEHGWPTHNLDAQNVLSHFEKLTRAGKKSSPIDKVRQRKRN